MTDFGTITRQALLDNGFVIALDDAMRAELATLAPAPSSTGLRDLTALLWSSIDNAESKDLDQIEVAESIADGGMRLLIGIADVDALVPRNSALDRHARANAT